MQFCFPSALTKNTTPLDDRYWEVFETLRRISLTGALVVLKPGSSIQLFTATMICYTSSLLYLVTKPFIDQSENTLAMLSQVDIFVLLTMGALFKLDPEEGTGDTKTTIIGVILIAGAVGVIVLAAIGVWLEEDEVDDATEDAWNNVNKWKSKTTKASGSEEQQDVANTDYPIKMQRNSNQDVAGMNPLGVRFDETHHANTMRNSDQLGL